MKQLTKIAFFSFLTVALICCGCSKKTTEPEPETDEEAIQWLIGESPSYFNTQDHYGEEDTTDGRPGVFSPIITYFWFRELTYDPQISINIDIVGDSAYVSWFGEFKGNLHLFSDTIFPPDTLIEYTKNFTDHHNRYAIFKRLFHQEEDPMHRRGWRLVMVTGAEMTSEINRVRIDSVRLNCTHYPDTLLTDPLAFFEKDDIITLSPEEKCSLTVYTNSDSVNVDHLFLHSWRRHIQHHRHEFMHIGDGIFSGVWFAPSNEAGAMDVIHHSAFDMIDKETLDDTEGLYDSNAWGMPYKVTTSY